MKRKISKFIFSLCAIAAFVIGLAGNGKVFASADPFMGEISYVAFNYAPREWLSCDGQLLNVGEHAALYSLLGTIYGGDGRSNFKLPDMRGRVPVHQGRGTGLSLYRMGQFGGYERITLTDETLPSHTHTATVGSGATANATLHAVNAQGDTPDPTDHALADTSGLGAKSFSTVAPTVAMHADSVKVELNDLSFEIGSTGGSQHFPVMQPFLTVNCIIAIEGIYPPRP